MLPIVYEGALAFLESKYFSARETMPYHKNHNAYDDMPKQLYESADWKKSVLFGVKSVTKYTINAFFFQLISTKIPSFEWTNKSVHASSKSPSSNSCIRFTGCSLSIVSWYTVESLAPPSCSSPTSPASSRLSNHI